MESLIELLASVESDLGDLLSGEEAAIYRNDPVFMQVVDQVEAANRLLSVDS